jgi:hypothetical protein
MKTKKLKMKAFWRKPIGDSIAEFGPALLIVLMVLFFPMLNMLTLATSYGLGMVLNYNQVHEASLVSYNDANSPSGIVMKGIPDQWMNGMGKFVRLSGRPGTVVSYRDGASIAFEGAGKTIAPDKIVNVKTTLSCNPFLPIPFFIANVPGLNGPMTFVINSDRVMENPDYAGQVAMASAPVEDEKLPVTLPHPPTVISTPDDDKPPIRPFTPWWGGWFGGMRGCR